MKSPLYITGETPCGRPLMGGLFTLKDTHGMSLDMAIELCNDVPALPDWCEYLADAGSQDGWKLDAATQDMRMLVGDDKTNAIMAKFKETPIKPGDTLQSACQRALQAKRDNGQKWESAMGLK